MNILQVISSTRASGAERHFVLLARNLRDLGHRVIVACPPGGWLSCQLDQAAIRVVPLCMRGPAAPLAVLTLRSIVRQECCELVHTHLTRATYLGYFAGIASRIPVVSTVHIWSRDLAYRRLPGGNHWLVAVSDYMRQSLISRGVAPARVVTVYNGTDLLAVGAESIGESPEANLSVSAEFGLPADAIVVGSIGHVDEFKGQPLLVEAAPLVLRNCPNTYLLFVGYVDPRIQQALWKRAADLGVADRLRFAGVRNDIPRLLKSMAVVALPSRTEACSMSIIEAMAMGRPVVATRAGGNPELVEHGVTGLLTNRTPQSLAEALSVILTNSSLRARMGAAGRQRAAALFSASAMAENMVSLYSRVLGHA